MKFTLSREELLEPLQMVCGVVDKKNSSAILSHLLIQISGNHVRLVGTDTEVEIVAHLTLEKMIDEVTLTLPARKLHDICRNSSQGVDLTFDVTEHRVVVKAGAGRFVLNSLPVEQFPYEHDLPATLEFSIAQSLLLEAMGSIYFSMAQKDVRHYLNGMLLELRQGLIRLVASDGHRLSMFNTPFPLDYSAPVQTIIPRKAVLELMRLLSQSEDPVDLSISANHIRVCDDKMTFTSKLIGGRFPSYSNVLPKGELATLILPCDELKQALQHASILSHEKYHGVRLLFANNELKITTNNPEQEEAELILPVNYSGAELDIGFNLLYLIETLNAIDSEQVELIIKDAKSSILVKDVSSSAKAQYILMPMRL